MVVTAIIPAYNEEISIGSIVLKTKKYVDHVIVIDDGSIDSTAEIAKDAGAEVIIHPKNKGKGGALRTGFQAANKNGTDIIVTIDADGQNDPDEIPKLLAPILSKNADMVIGSKFLNSGKKVPFPIRMGQMVLDIATNVGNHTKISDTQSGFRAFAIHTVPFFKFENNDFSIESEMINDAVSGGLNIKEVGIKEIIDIRDPKDGARVLYSILQDMKFRKPFYYFTVGIIFYILLMISRDWRQLQK